LTSCCGFEIMQSKDREKIIDAVLDKVRLLLSREYGRLVIEKHQNNVYVEDTFKDRTVLKTR